MSYLSDPHQGKYYFLLQGATISWNLTKQRLASSTHSKTIALHEASRECAWLQLVDSFIKSSCGFLYVMASPTVILGRLFNLYCSNKSGLHQKRPNQAHLTKVLFTHYFFGSHVVMKQIRSSNNKQTYLLSLYQPLDIDKLLRE